MTNPRLPFILLAVGLGLTMLAAGCARIPTALLENPGTGERVECAGAIGGYLFIEAARRIQRDCLADWRAEGYRRVPGS